METYANWKQKFMNVIKIEKLEHLIELPNDSIPNKGFDRSAIATYVE